MAETIQRKDPDGVLRNKIWYALFRHNGKRICKSMKTENKREADGKMWKLIESMRDGKTTAQAMASQEPAQARSFAAVKARYIAERPKMQKRGGGYISPRTILIDERALAAYDATARPQTITDLTVKSMLDVQYLWTKTHPRGKAVRNRDLRALKTFARWAEEAYALPAQRWDKVHIEADDQREDWYQPEDLERLRAGLPDERYRTIVMLCHRLGLRPGEAFNLPWSRIDWSTEKARIADYKGWSPKNKQSHRWLPIPPDLIEYLLLLRKMQPKSEYVMPWGSPRTDHGQRSMESMYRTITVALGLRGSLYTLRHTFASEKASAGESLHIIGQLMGHKPGSNSTQVYAHLSDDALRRAVSVTVALKPFMPTGIAHHAVAQA